MGKKTTSHPPEHPPVLWPGPAGFVVGAWAVLWGVRKLIGDAELRRLALAPIALTALLYAGTVIALALFADNLLSLLWKRPEPGALLWSWYIFLPILFVSMLLGLMLLFSTVAEAIGGPFYDRVARRILVAHTIPVHDPGFLKGTLPDLFRSLGFLFVACLFSLLGLIPVVGVPFTLLGAFIAWLGLAASAINPALTLAGLGPAARVAHVLRSFTTMAGMGAVMGLSLVIVPFLGLVAIPGAIVGATQLYARALTTPNRRWTNALTSTERSPERVSDAVSSGGRQAEPHRRGARWKK